MDPNASMPQGKDSAVERQQLSSANPIFYLPSSQTKSDQLPPSDDAVLFLGQAPNRSRRLVGRGNALHVRWVDRALHRRSKVVALAWGHALSRQWTDRALHLGAGGLGHGATVPGDGARVVHSALRPGRDCLT